MYNENTVNWQKLEMTNVFLNHIINDPHIFYSSTRCTFTSTSCSSEKFCWLLVFAGYLRTWLVDPYHQERLRFLLFQMPICISKIKMIFQSFLEVLLNKEFYNFIDQIELSVQIKIKNHEILIMKYLKKWQLFINIFYFRSSRPDMFCKKGVLENFAKFYGKHLCQSLFFNKVAALRPATLLKKRL